MLTQLVRAHVDRDRCSEPKKAAADASDVITGIPEVVNRDSYWNDLTGSMSANSTCFSMVDARLYVGNISQQKTKAVAIIKFINIASAKDGSASEIARQALTVVDGLDAVENAEIRRQVIDALARVGQFTAAYDLISSVQDGADKDNCLLRLITVALQDGFHVENEYVPDDAALKAASDALSKIDKSDRLTADEAKLMLALELLRFPNTRIAKAMNPQRLLGEVRQDLLGKDQVRGESDRSILFSRLCQAYVRLHDYSRARSLANEYCTRSRDRLAVSVSILKEQTATIAD